MQCNEALHQALGLLVPGPPNLSGKNAQAMRRCAVAIATPFCSGAPAWGCQCVGQVTRVLHRSTELCRVQHTTYDEVEPSSIVCCDSWSCAGQPLLWHNSRKCRPRRLPGIPPPPPVVLLSPARRAGQAQTTRVRGNRPVQKKSPSACAISWQRPSSSHRRYVETRAYKDRTKSDAWGATSLNLLMMAARLTLSFALRPSSETIVAAGSSSVAM